MTIGDLFVWIANVPLEPVLIVLGSFAVFLFIWAGAVMQDSILLKIGAWIVMGAINFFGLTEYFDVKVDFSSNDFKLFVFIIFLFLFLSFIIGAASLYFESRKEKKMKNNPIKPEAT